MRPRGPFAVVIPIALLALTVFSACTSTANVSDVYTSLDSEGFRRRTKFFTDTKEIHCIAEVGVGRPNVTIEAYIHQIVAYDFATNDFVDVDRYGGYAEIQPQPKKDGPVLVDLTLGRVGPDGQPTDDAPFVAGSYICEVSLDGEVQGTAAFNIDLAPCPPAFVVPGGPCLGFYAEGTECPKFGERSKDPAACTCTPKGWDCDPG